MLLYRTEPMNSGKLLSWKSKLVQVEHTVTESLNRRWIILRDLFQVA